MPIVSGFVVPKLNPTRHVGNIRLLRPVVVTVEHQEDCQAENYESKAKEEPRVIGTGTLIHSFGSMNLSLVI